MMQLQWKQQQQHRRVNKVEGESYDRSIGEQGYNRYNSSSFIDRKLLKITAHIVVRSCCSNMDCGWVRKKIEVGKSEESCTSVAI